LPPNVERERGKTYMGRYVRERQGKQNGKNWGVRT